MTLRIALLGPAQLSHDGSPLKLPGYQAPALLAYLLLTGRPHSRQHLTELLFVGPDDPRGALRWTLSQLRKAVGAEALRADRDTIAFNQEVDYWLDVDAFAGGSN
jgi:DNA-binding SARP family transcriptional activator